MSGRSKPTYDEKHFWESRYRRNLFSGEGSRGDELLFKQRILKDVLSECTPKPTLIDLGFGDGFLCFSLGDHVSKYTGFDISETATAACSKKSKDLGYNHFEFMCCDIRDVGGYVVDVVVCMDVLFHMPTKDKFDRVVSNICDMFDKFAIFSVWSSSIVEARSGSFAKHNNYFALELPKHVLIRDEYTAPDNIHKKIIVLEKA